MKLPAITFLALGLLSFPATAHHVPDHLHDVTVKVDGMVCDFCAQSISKLFEQKAEIEKVDINFDTKEVLLDFKPGSTIPNEEIKNVIDYAGYKIVDIVR